MSNLFYLSFMLDFLVLFVFERYWKNYKKSVMKNLDKECYNTAVDNYLYCWVVLVYLEETEWRGTERQKYYVLKNNIR